MNLKNRVNITLMCGISASGKTTRARELKDDNTTIVSRDTLRELFFPNNGVKRLLFPHQEKFITFKERQQIASEIAKRRNVIIDDTNLRASQVQKLIDYCYSCGERFGQIVQIRFEFTYDGELDQCIERNRQRIDRVPEDVIIKQAQLWRRQSPRLYTLSDDIECGEYNPVIDREKVYLPTLADVIPYKPDLSKPKCIISDIDGTVARALNRDVYDIHGVSTDTPRMEVISLLKSLSHEYKIIFVSGRDEECREDTEKWLKQYFKDMPIELYMRTHKDVRADDTVKYEIFNEHFRGNYNVCGWFDDRHRVSRMVELLGVPLFFVGYLDYEF